MKQSKAKAAAKAKRVRSPRPTESSVAAQPEQEQEQAPIIYVPAPAAESFNPGRPLSGNALLQSQVQHFQELNAQLPDAHRGDFGVRVIETEADASEFIREVTARLRAHHGLPSEVKVRKAT